jgi:multidrug efflux pump subunit AcrA (membrane-fusion protein)
MSAEVNIITDRHDDVVLVPAGAVASGKLFVAEDGRAHERAVRVGLRDPHNVEIVSGLKAGERVVIVGPKGLADGQRVSAIDGLTPVAERKSQNTMTVR